MQVHTNERRQRAAGRAAHQRNVQRIVHSILIPIHAEWPEFRLHSLVRSYFKLDGHHMQFNVVTADALREAKANPGAHRDLIVRVAGYSDYFCDLSEALQDEIIRRTEHVEF